MDQYIGKLLDNRYEILEVVGSGGMAKVYKARCHRLNRLVAIKILREDLSQDAEFRRRFHDESQAVAMLSHPNIVAVYDVSRSSELEYIVMELIDGITLKQYMQKKGNKLNWREALHFITQITKALGHAHSRGIIHRDIKPHNVMVLRDGSVKVADFGIARVASGGHSTLTQEALGSVHYISPEQARGSHIDARSDLYSAGVVLYEMLTGRLPFEGDTPVSVAIQHINSIPLSPRELEPSIPEALEVITMRAMAPNPDNRYLSADDMLADLEEFRKNPNINFDYSPAELEPEEELDEDRTQIRPIRTGGSRSVAERRYEEDYPPARRGSHRYEEEPQRRRHRYEDDEDDYPQRSSIWPVVLAAVAVLLFVVIVAYFLVTTVFSSFFNPPTTYPVPDVMGQLYDEVKDDSELLGRFRLVKGETVTNDAEPGTILTQSPKENTQVEETVTEITVTVSGGPETIPMIDLTGKDFNDACTELRALGLKPVVPPEYENDDAIEQNHIISYTPLKGALLSPGTEVHMVVSRGPKVEEIDMPNLIGKTETEAKNLITMYKLVSGRIEPQHDETVEEGKVISQYPLANTKVDEGTVVNLIISSGPDPEQQPPTPPPVEPDPNLVTREETIDLSNYEGIINLRVLMDGVEVCNENVDTTMDVSWPVRVSGTGVKELAIYINGIASGTKEVDFTQGSNIQ
ncbi:MAG: Stk1 family PASTA domain-containing Ser/Thr kinase [Lawsonibacter sp.]|nr:Stk1 family PASTA domain-containing Ser/Thr kinase [Lawsonibacter sp.]